MPTRRPLIIGSAYSDDEIRLGVIKDLDNWNRFLRSPVGGAWNENEITILDTLDEQDVFEAMSNMFGIDYGLVVFSGHGSLQKLDRTTGECVTNVVIGGTEIIEDFLYPETKKSLVIFDCCRGVVADTIILESLNAAEAAGLPTVKTASLDLYLASRRVYDSAISAMPEARVLIYSVSPEVLASGPDDIGGLFTHFFLEGACEFDIQSDRLERLFDVRRSDIVYANEAFRWAVPRVNAWRVQHKKEPQNPCYVADRLRLHPPIAVRL